MISVREGENIQHLCATYHVLVIISNALEVDNITPIFPRSEAEVKKSETRASLVAQWLRICLPMQGTRVRALVWEDPTCHGATRPVSHNC